MTSASAQKLLYLHVGTNKAGSTSLQYALRALKTPIDGYQAVSAFGLPNASLLAAAAGGQLAYDYFVTRHKVMTHEDFVRNAETVWQSARREVDASEARVFVSSSEFLAAQVYGADIESLRLKLEEVFDRIEIVFYLREQVSYLRSVWAQAVKGPARSTETFGSFDAQLDRHRRYLDYAGLVKGWCDVFGARAITVNLVDPATLQGGDVVTDFFHMIGLGQVPVGKKGPPKRRNVSPGWDELERIRSANLAALAAENMPPADVDGPGDPPSPEAYRVQVIAQVSSGNRWLNEVFL